MIAVAYLYLVWSSMVMGLAYEPGIETTCRPRMGRPCTSSTVLDVVATMSPLRLLKRARWNSTRSRMVLVTDVSTYGSTHTTYTHTRNRIDHTKEHTGQTQDKRMILQRDFHFRVPPVLYTSLTNTNGKCCRKTTHALASLHGTSVVVPLHQHQPSFSVYKV